MTSAEQVLTSPEQDPHLALSQRARWIIGVAVVLVLVTGAGMIATQLLTQSDGPVTHRFVVPAGTAARAAAGEVIEVLPPDLEVHVGDRLVIENDDSADFGVGPYLVKHGETLEQTFRRRGAISGSCGLTPTNEIRIFIT